MCTFDIVWNNLGRNQIWKYMYKCTRNGPEYALNRLFFHFENIFAKNLQKQGPDKTRTSGLIRQIAIHAQVLAEE